jgi:hypothetical protein
VQRRRVRARALALVAAAGFAACFGPQDRRPGMHLAGDPAPIPADWSFTAAHREIAVEVATPYLLPHSVTVWCAADGADLYLGARDPDTKRWPGWVDRDPDVRLGIGDAVYDVRLAPVDDATALERVRAAYAAKYELPASTGEAPPIRYWRVAPRT